MSAKSEEVHFHLGVLHSARLRIKVHSILRPNESLTSWLTKHEIYCDPKKVIHPSTWRISYGVLTRFARALGYRKTDMLYRELTQ